MKTLTLIFTICTFTLSSQISIDLGYEYVIQKQTMKPKRIDFNTMTFESCNVNYTIDATTMSHPRLREFLRLMPTVSIGMSWMNMVAFVDKLFNVLTKGEKGFKESWFEVTNMIFNWKKSFANHNSEKFLDENLDNILRFCALVCIAPGENTLVLSESVINKKVADFKKDMNMFDFFLLSKKLVPKLQELYQGMQTTRNPDAVRTRK